MPAKPHFNPVVLRQVVAELKAHGEYSEALLRGMGFTPEALDKDPEFLVSYRQISTVVRRALRQSAGAALGHRVGRRRTVVSVGLPGLGLMTSGTVHEACEFLAHRPWAFGTPLRVAVSFDPAEGLAVTVSPRFDDHAIKAFLVEEFFCALLGLLRGLAGPSFNASRIDLSAPPDATKHALCEFLGAEVRCLQGADRLYIDAALARMVPPSADAVVMQGVAQMLQQRAVAQPRPSDVVATIEQLMREQIADPPTLVQVADLLHTSERTLRRKLGEQQTSYQQLLDMVRRDHALSLLQGDGAQLSAVASALGFSDVRNLRRAVRRWTGQAPTALRKEAPV